MTERDQQTTPKLPSLPDGEWSPTGRIAMIGREGRAAPCQEWINSSGNRMWQRFPFIEVDELQFAGLHMLGRITLKEQT